MRTNQPYDRDDLQRKDKRHAVHGFVNFATFFDSDSEILVEADGAYVTDIDGNRLLDGMGGVWCVNIGYGRDEMAEAVAEQMRRLPFASPFRSTTTPPATELSAKLAALSPGDLNHVFYSGGGSTANDSALRIIEHYFNHLGKPDKKRIVCRGDAYHGSTSVTAALSGIPFNRIGLDTPDIGVLRVSAPYIYRHPEDMTEEEFCDHLVAEFDSKLREVGPDTIACFYAEPVMGMGGVLVSSPGYFKRIGEICREHGILVIADEVVTGFGRLGEFFASDAIFEMSPDIITCAKGLTSGYLPMGATLISDRIFDVIKVPFQEGAVFAHGFTYAEHPVCCAAALKNIEIMEREELCAAVRDKSTLFWERLSALRDLPLVGDVRGMGFMWGIECVADKRTKALLPAEASVGARISNHARDLGLIVRPLGHINVLSPPLILTRKEINTLADVLRTSIERTQDDLVREGFWRG